MTPIPVTIITGFLGAGKTTLLNALLRDPAFADSAVLINEFGEVSIDHDLIAEFSQDLIETVTGCLCCTASNDVKQSLFDLWQRRKNRKIRGFKRVIIETTGLIDPAPIINSLLAPPKFDFVDRIVTGQFALSRVLALFDIVNGAATLDRHLEAVKQLALADAIILTKTDLARDPATQNDIARSTEQLRSINPAAVILDRHLDWPAIRDLIKAAGTYDLRTKGEDALAWLKVDAILAGSDHGHAHDDRSRHGDIASHCIVIDKPISNLIFNFFLNALKLSAGPDLLRVKGLVALSDDPDRPVVVHGVRHLVQTIDKLDRWPSDDRRTRLVMIGRNLNVEAMRSILTSASPRRPRAVKRSFRKPGIAALVILAGATLGVGWLAAKSSRSASAPQVPNQVNERSVP